jgi:phi13 family phage major tail protein
MAANKIRYGLKNVHYAKLTETVDPVTGTVTNTYGTVKAWPGAVSLNLEPQGEISNEYADDGVWYTFAQNSGYQGDFEYETMPEDFRSDILGETVDSNEVFIEETGKPTVYFALLFEVNGDAHKSKKCFYKCSATRENVENATTEDSIEATHGTITITAVGRSDGKVKASTGSETSSTIVNGWFSSVYETPTEP